MSCSTARRTHVIASASFHGEARLALAVLWLVMCERAAFTAYWARAQLGETKVYDSCRQPYREIAAALRREGWEAAN